MKVHLSNPVDLAKQFPIVDRLPNWFFRVTERSAGAYFVGGINLSGQTVSREGTDAEKVLDDCIAMAREMSRAHDRT